MKTYLSIIFLIITTTQAKSQLTIKNNSDFNYELVFITPADKPLETKGVCFNIINQRQNNRDLNSTDSITIPCEISDGLKYDLFLVDTSKWGGYEHTACLHSITLSKNRTISITNVDVPRPFFYHCEERKMYENETSLELFIHNKSQFRIIEFSYAIDDLTKYEVHRYLAPWSPLEKTKSGTYSLTYIKKEGIEKELKLKLRFERDGIFNTKEVSLKFNNDKLDYVFEE